MADKIDQQTSISLVLRPPTGFEAIYQGQPLTSPIPLVAPDDRGEYLPLDAQVTQSDVSPKLARYVPVPLFSTIMLVLPRPIAINPETDELVQTAYTYEFRWRLRDVSAWVQTQKTPFHMVGAAGAPDGNEVRKVIPSYTTLASQLQVAGSPANVLVGAGGDEGVAAQGSLDPAQFAAATTGEQLATGPQQWFAPCLQTCYGDELSVVIYRTAGGATWDFGGVDAGISNVYGTNQIGPTRAQPLFGLGALLITGVRAAGP